MKQSAPRNDTPLLRMEGLPHHGTPPGLQTLYMLLVGAG